MKPTSFVICSFLVAASGVITLRAWGQQGDQPRDWTEQATSPDGATAQNAQARLRDAGPLGLRWLEQRFASEISWRRSGGPAGERWKRIAAALDHVGGQYDDYVSGLYWYTDLDQAKAAAKASGQPILSLRLLGRLDEDLSCANSRFFRTTLYPTAAINRLLKDRFILHWESVRQVPKVTIEFGGGRTIERTITGNSIHYVLDADGKVVDALPGLYTAPVFAAELGRAADAVNQPRIAQLQSTRARLLREWATDLGVPAGDPVSESPLVRLMTDDRWQQVARLHADSAIADAGAQAVMSQKFPNAQTAALMAVSKSGVEMPMLRALTNLTRTTSLDTVRNNYLLRTRILGFLADPGTQSLSLRQINDWVYAQVFLTPLQDPWLGLVPPDVFAAIDRNGETR